jgi:hypothetical protein
MRKCIRSRIVRLSNRTSYTLRTPATLAAAVTEITGDIYIFTLHTYY